MQDGRIAHRSRYVLAVACLVGFAAIGLVSNTALRQVPAHAQPSEPIQMGYEVVAAYPHDPNAFLQGLVWYAGGLYESTGLNGRSSLRQLAFPSGDVLQRIDLPREYFGEGLALVGDRLVQLTWRSGLGFVYDRGTFALLDEFRYQT